MYSEIERAPGASIALSFQANSQGAPEKYPKLLRGMATSDKPTIQTINFGPFIKFLTNSLRMK
jgi:hypothetical protein